MSYAGFDGRAFIGAKPALFFGQHLVVTLRDDRPGLPYRAMWDFPGGGREAGETPVDCVMRETREELGLELVPGDLCWGRGFGTGPVRGWLFLARVTRVELGKIRFGEEGQGWRLMLPDIYLGHPRGIPFLKQRLAVARACMPTA